MLQREVQSPLCLRVGTHRTGGASAAAAALAVDDGPLLVLDNRKEERARKVCVCELHK
jgi:hypothetical protein